MTLTQAATEVRSILAERNGDTIPAIRFMRGLGLSFTTARQYVQEIKADKPWWSTSKKRTRKA